MALVARLASLEAFLLLQKGADGTDKQTDRRERKIIKKEKKLFFLCLSLLCTASNKTEERLRIVSVCVCLYVFHLPGSSSCEPHHEHPHLFY